MKHLQSSCSGRRLCYSSTVQLKQSHAGPGSGDMSRRTQSVRCCT